MATASLDDITALNDQLTALLTAGVRLDVGLAPLDLPPDKALERINSTVVRRVNRGESLSEALEGDEGDIPPSYSSLVRFGLATGDLPRGLDDSNRVAESVDESRYVLESAFIYPLVVCCLAYVGLIGMCLFLLPVWEDMYRSLRVPPGTGVRVLGVLRDTLPIWGTILPVLLLMFFAWRRHSKTRRETTGLQSSRLLSWLPGVAQALFQQRCARFSSSLADMLHSGMPWNEALSIAADGSGDDKLRAGARMLQTGINGGLLPDDSSAAAQYFPPFLRWALWHSDATTGRKRALQIAATMYRDAASRRAERLRTLAPIVALVLIGGIVTLLYCLALFVPFVELLKAVAR